LVRRRRGLLEQGAALLVRNLHTVDHRLELCPGDRTEDQLLGYGQLEPDLARRFAPLVQQALAKGRVDRGPLDQRRKAARDLGASRALLPRPPAALC
jgi:hypothetical protein